MQILWIKSGPLHPLDTGGKKRTHSMLVELNKMHEVTYLALKDERESLDPVEEVAPYASHKVWVPWREASRGSLGWVVELLWNAVSSTQPYALAKYRSREMAAEIRSRCAEGRFDLIVCDFLVSAVNFEELRDHLEVPAVLFQHNIEAVIWRRLATGKSNPVARWYFGMQAKRMERWECRLSEGFDGVITVSKEDSEVARREYGLTNVLGDVPAGVDVAYFTPSAESSCSIRTIGFLGSMDWMPNIEAVHWFVSKVFPQLESSCDDFRFIVIGRRPPRSIRDLADRDPRIEVTGTVDDVRPSLGRCDFLVVPLLSGGGTRIKIMEALAAGLPVVSTTVGAEGLGLMDGQHVMIADSVDDFAKATGDLLADAQKRMRLGIAGRELVESEYSWRRAVDVFMTHAEKVMLVKRKQSEQGSES